MAIEFKLSSKDDQDFKYVKVLIYGPSGSGKTHLIKTLIDADYKVGIFNTDKGLLTLRSHAGKYFHAPAKDHDSAKEIVRILYQDGPTKKLPFDVIVIDSLTELMKYIYDGIIDGTGREQPTRGEWNSIIERTRTFVRRLRDLPYHIYMTCLVREESDDQEDVINYRPNLIGRLSNDVMGYFDEIFFLRSREPKDEEEAKKSGGRMVRYLITDASGRILAKDRSGNLNRNEKPDLGYLFNKIVADPKDIKKSFSKLEPCIVMPNTKEKKKTKTTGTKKVEVESEQNTKNL